MIPRVNYVTYIYRMAFAHIQIYSGERCIFTPFLFSLYLRNKYQLYNHLRIISNTNILIPNYYYAFAMIPRCQNSLSAAIRAVIKDQNIDWWLHNRVTYMLQFR